MSSRTRFSLVSCLLLVIVALLVQTVHAQDQATSPLTLDDIRKLRQQQKAHDEIVKLAAERGLAFDVQGSELVQLTRMRFTREQIDALREARANGPTGAAPAADPAAANEKPGDAKPREENPDAPLGPRKPEAWQVMNEQVVKEIIQLSGVGVKPWPAGSFTIVASEPVAREHMADANRLQTMLARAYGGVFKSGLDRRSANIVLLETQYDYDRFIDAMFAVYEKRGARFDGPDPKRMAKESASFSTGTMAIINLAKIQRGKSSRTAVAYQIGCMMMKQLSEGRASDGMVTGFGNVCEVLLYDQPAFTTISYEPRAVNATNSWANEVRTLIRENRLGRPRDVLQSYTTSTMQMPNYAEAWSLMTVLSQEREKFEPLIVAVRDAPAGTPTMNLVEQVYKVDEAKLRDVWIRFAQ